MMSPGHRFLRVMRRAALAPVLTIAVAISLAPPREARARAPGDGVTRAAIAITEHDYDRARAELAGLEAVDDEAVRVELARLSLYEGDCDRAVRLLARSDPSGLHVAYEGSDVHGRELLDISRGCARVTAATVVEKDAAAGVEVRFQDEDDRAIFPLVVETTVKARAALTRDLGATWPLPTRITFVRDLLSLSAMTGLPYEAARTTGTVGIAKWGTVTILSPRASHRGYPWRDTLAHELTHLAVTRASLDRAPLWLQEGVAKLEETRWREPSPFDGRPPPDAIVQRGVDLKLDVPLDRLGPSIAMLPSADAAMVAFAEVTSFVRFLEARSPEGTLQRLLGALRTMPVEGALREVTKLDLGQWDAEWRGDLSRKPRAVLSPLFGLGSRPPDARSARDRARLAELLLGRGHASLARRQIDRITGDVTQDPSLRHLRARILESASEEVAARAVVRDPASVVASSGPWWAIRGRLARSAGDGAEADPSFTEAAAHDPFSIETSCETIAPTGGRSSAMCAAARRWNLADIGRD